MAGPVRPPVGRTFVMAVVLLTVAWFLVTFVLQVRGNWQEQAQVVIVQLQVASLLVALAVGGGAISRWYLTGDAPALWIGVALSIYGIIRLGMAELLPLVVISPDLAMWLGWLRPASQVVVLALLVRAATVAPVWPDVAAPRLVLLSLVAVGGIAFGLQFFPAVATAIDGASGATPRSYTALNIVGLVPFASGALAVAFTWQGYRRRRWLFTWLGLLLLAIVLADVARVVAPPPLESGMLAKEVLRLLGVLLALNGAMRELLYTYRDSSTRLAESEYTALTAQERIRAGQADAEERSHEARSALAAIEGATRTLEHYRDRLPPETQAALSTAISGEVRRLQELVSAEQTIGEIAPFSLAQSLAPLVVSERARGAVINVNVPGDLHAMGRSAAVEQITQTLFDNARRYSAGSPIDVRAETTDTWVVLRVEDRGPGVPPAHRERIFERGFRGNTPSTVAGTGLGLYVAAKLAADQDGKIWVDDRPGGGASFAVALPSVQSDVAEKSLQGIDDGVEVVEGGRLSATHRSN